MAPADGQQVDDLAYDIKGVLGATELQTVQQIAESGAKQVPAIFRTRIKLESEQASPYTQLVPVIDLSCYLHGDDKDKARIREEVAQACQEWGYFQVVNHGVAHSVLEDALDVSRRFFKLPFKDKVVYATKPGDWVGYGRASQNGWNDILAHHLAPVDQNQMGSQWPAQPADYREKMHRYNLGIQGVADHLYEILSLNLGLSPGHIKEAFASSGGENPSIIRTNYYPACPQPDVVLGVSPHSDAGTITILLQTDTVSGLQIRHKEEWVPIQPIPGALVVNVGDVLQIFSNGVYPSVEHRAVVSSINERMSLVVFFTPTANTTLAPAPELLTAHKPPVYASILYLDYLRLRDTCLRKGERPAESMMLPKPEEDVDSTSKASA